MASASSRLAMGDGAPWSKLPEEVVERVLSFLPLPTLCRLRTVCKGWNDLLCGPSFHGLYENRCREVIVLTRFELTDEEVTPQTRRLSNCVKLLDPRVQSTTSFLDLAERRWYSITRSSDLALCPHTLAMADGLVATSWCDEEGDHGNCRRVKISNPFLDRIQSLETPGVFRWFYYHELPTLAVATDCLSHSLRVFLMDNAYSHQGFLSIHESGRWHHARPAPNPKCDGDLFKRCATNGISTARSAVVFRSDLYAILSPYYSDVCFLMKYNCERDTWTVIFDDAPSQSMHPQLLVSGDRLFMSFWRSGATLNDRLLEILEIVENASRTVLQVPSAILERFFGEPVDDLACVVPRGLRSDGSCSAVALVLGLSGRAVFYDVVSGSVDVLPAQPLGEAQVRPSNPSMHYWATNTNLSCRDFLSPRMPSRPPLL